MRIRELSKVGAVVDAALALSITNISPVRFSISSVKTATLRDSLLADATRRARQEAAVIAAASGSELGHVRSITTQGETPRYGFDMSVATSASGLGTDRMTPTQNVEPLVQVSVTVSGRWLLVPKP